VGSPQEAATEQIKVRPPKHLAFQHLQTIDMAFDGAVTVVSQILHRRS